MKGVLFIVASLVTYAHSENVRSDDPISGMKAIVVKCEKESEYDAVKQFENELGYDFLRLLSNPIEPIQVLVTDYNFQNFRTVLKKHNITYDVVHNDFSQRILYEFDVLQNLRYRRDTNFITNYPTYTEIKNSLYEYEKRRRDIVKVVNIGESFEGRKLLGIQFSSGRGKNRPAIVIEAGIYGRDWISISTAMNIINELSLDSNANLYRNVDIYIFPLINPDGYAYSHRRPENRLWKKTRSLIPGSKCVGVDANRNFDIDWNLVGFYSLKPCSNKYAGSKPLSEPEVKALTTFMSNRKNIGAYLALHSYGNDLLYPYSHSLDNPRNLKRLKCVADKAVNLISNVRGTRYTINNAAQALGLITGTSTDWAMAKAGAKLAYLMDLSTENFQFSPPRNEILPVSQEAFKVVKILSKYADGRPCRFIDYLENN